MRDYIIGWEKFKFPDEVDDEENEDRFDEDGYNDSEEGEEYHGGILIPQSVNPFFQLKKYNLWTAHTNFKITQPVALIINEELGVETLDIITPYRFHMSVGLRFDEKEIKLNVTNKVIKFLKQYEKNRRNE